VEPGQTLSHYRLLEKIGEGGMGVVWKAEDAILGRMVAIKVLPADVANDEGRRRMFLDEARLASSVSDAHIAQVHELGREGGLDFIVMEFVEGKPLHRVLHGRPIPPDKVVALGHQVAQALSRAHRKGLLHRDLKPSNILLTPDGEVKVVDFGLATLVERRDTSHSSDVPTDATTATRHDWGQLSQARRDARLVGTLPYMSPEQARAEKPDARSDIFSLGVVLYEMTTGQRPFSGATNVALLKEISRARPRPPHELSQKIPLELERIIQKALAPTLADRYQTMDDLAVDLRRLGRELESGSSPSYDELTEALRPAHRYRIWGLAVAVTVATGIGIWLFELQSGARLDRQTILVLPMEVRGQNEGGDYVGRAFAEAIAVNLAQSKDLKVLPVPEGSQSAAAGTEDHAAAARRLGAGRLVTGSVARDGKVVHASLSLVDTQRNRILWGAQKDDADGSLSGLASLLSSKLSAALGVVARRRYDYPLYMMGTGAMAASPITAEALGALRRYEIGPAMEATKRLVEAFPNEPDALALRAYSIMRSLGRGGIDQKTLDESLRDLARVDPEHATALNIRCEALQRDALLECSARLLSRDDLTPAARAWALRDHSVAKIELGDSKGALEEVQEATDLDPTNFFNLQTIGQFREKTKDLGGAEAAFRQCSALVPGYSGCYVLLSEALTKQGEPKAALEPLRTACQVTDSQEACARLALALSQDGQQAAARAAAERAAIIPKDAPGLWYLAAYWGRAGEKGKALDLLQESFASGAVYDPDDIKNLETSPDLAGIRVIPQFKSLLREAKKHIGP
jgi:eukaryotic-like serine/threonine-protein kinase